MRNERGTIKLLLKNSDNRRWYFKNWSVKLFSYFTAFVSVWTVLDYDSVVIHVFSEDTRRFYDLERLWQDAETVSTASFLEDE